MRGGEPGRLQSQRGRGFQAGRQHREDRPPGGCDDDDDDGDDDDDRDVEDCDDDQHIPHPVSKAEFCWKVSKFLRYLKENRLKLQLCITLH